jgi:transketolase
MYSAAAKKRAEQLGLVMGKPNLEVFAETLLGLARADVRVQVVTSDSRGSGKLAPYGKALPEQIVEVGIAEQNLVALAAGLAAGGKIVFAVSPACFLTARALEQIKNDVAYSDHAVRLVGISAGVSYGALGSTHHSLHDLAALRAINNLDIIVPADNAEARAAVKLAASFDAPVYLRFGKAALYDLRPSNSAVDIRAAAVLRNGNDLAFIATGETVIHALLAAAELHEREGINARVLSVPSVRPLDTPIILNAARQCRGVITVEEHMLNGGLGEACASLFLETGVHPRFRRVGIPDEYTVTGSQADIFRHYGISMEGLANTAAKLLNSASLERRAS